MNSLTDPLVNGFILGMSTGPLCFTSCFPVLLSVTLSEVDQGKSSSSWLFLWKFIGGRFFAYVAFGLIIALLGSQLGTASHRLGTYATILLSLILVAYGLGTRIPHFGICRMIGQGVGRRFFPVVLGGLTGLNICPPFLLAIAYVLQREVNPAFGILFFMSFFLATTLYILPVGLTGHISRHRTVALVGRIAAVVVGAVFFYQGLSALRLG